MAEANRNNGLFREADSLFVDATDQEAQLPMPDDAFEFTNEAPTPVFVAATAENVVSNANETVTQPKRRTSRLVRAGSLLAAIGLPLSMSGAVFESANAASELATAVSIDPTATPTETATPTDTPTTLETPTPTPTETATPIDTPTPTETATASPSPDNRPSTSPSPTPTPTPTPPTQRELAKSMKIFGHRGRPYSGGYENTYQSCINAIKHKANGCEGDINKSASGNLFWFHDDTLGPKTKNCSGSFHSHSTHYIGHCLLNNGQHIQRFSTYLAGLHKYLKNSGQTAELMPELKSKYITKYNVGKMIHSLNYYGFNSSNLHIQSSYYDKLRYVKDYAPHVDRFYLRFSGVSNPANLNPNTVTGFITDHYSLDKAYSNNPNIINSFHKRGIKVIAYNQKTLYATQRDVKMDLDAEILNPGVSSEFTDWRDAPQQ